MFMNIELPNKISCALVQFSIIKVRDKGSFSTIRILTLSVVKILILFSDSDSELAVSCNSVELINGEVLY